jgi:hypothetical protein
MFGGFEEMEIRFLRPASYYIVYGTFVLESTPSLFINWEVLGNTQPGRWLKKPNPTPNF